MSISIRIKSLHLGTQGASLSSAENHGKRLDQSSQQRKLRDIEPLVYGSLDLRDAYNAHVEGCRMNKSVRTPVQHALIKFPSDIEITHETEAQLLQHAVDFINKTYGSDAVFAARLDRDELGKHNVDVFFTPKYIKSTKSHGDQLWISTTKHGKELCHKHRDEIIRRDNKNEFKTGPRQVGQALQSEIRSYFEDVPLIAEHLRAKVEKTETKSDWLRVEDYKIKQRDTLIRKYRRYLRNAIEMIEKYAPTEHSIKTENPIKKGISGLKEKLNRFKSESSQDDDFNHRP